MRRPVKEFLYYNFSKNKAEAENLYNELTKEQEFNKMYCLFTETAINKEMIKKIKKKLYSISFNDISDLIDKGDVYNLKKFNVHYNKEQDKWYVPSEIVLLGALNDILGPFDRLTPLNKEEILGWALGEKRRERTLAGLAVLGGAFLLAMYPFMYNFSNYMYGIPALFYWFNFSNLLFMLGSNIPLERNLRRGYGRLHYLCRQKIADEIFDTYKKQGITPENISLEDILKGVEKRKQEIFQKLIDDRAGKKEESLRGVLDWEHFLSKFGTGKSIVNTGISLAVLTTSPVFFHPIIGPAMTIFSAGLSSIDTYFSAKNAVIYGKGKETFKEKISKKGPEEALWEILTFLNIYKKRKILGNKLLMLGVAFAELLGILTICSNPNTALDIGTIGFLIANLFNFYQPITAYRSLKKENTRVDKVLKLKEKVKIVY